MKELVSIVIVCYNSEKYVLETLSSCLNQTYGPENINLIISDDCSSDNTVYIVEQWLRNYNTMFNSVKFLRSSENQGVTKNCNKGWESCITKWVKTIAADDVLCSNCIHDNFAHIDNLTSERVGVVFSNIQTFSNATMLSMRSQKKLFSNKNSDKGQLDYLLLNGGINLAPSSFINLDVLKDVDYADTSIRNIEDYLLWLKILNSGYSFSYLDSTTVMYRVSESVSHSKINIINDNYLNDKINSIYISLNYASKLKVMIVLKDRLLFLKRLSLISKLFNNKKSKISSFVLILNKAFSLSGYVERYLRGKYDR
ncbi:glycosyltransferase family 2 protein [Vibrio splendidus]|uniref:glycosyltransferase family 2 protein n=1 Tax=Vibrio splendidus TaxID=29497 RepID=UPI000D337B5E|nr:glycosyltransferase family 2 protein [Vibrio splendidus]PTP92708.1 glycosyltransferase [Vibrio splendidus]